MPQSVGQRAVVVATGGVGSRKGRAPRSGRTARRPQPQPAKQQPTATLTLTYGADLYTILGHANVKTTQIYAKIVNENENKRKAVNLILVAFLYPDVNRGLFVLRAWNESPVS